MLVAYDKYAECCYTSLMDKISVKIHLFMLINNCYNTNIYNRGSKKKIELINYVYLNNNDI